MFSDVTLPVVSGFANADLGGKNAFLTKIGNFDSVVFFNGTGRILTRRDFDHFKLFRY